VADPWFAETLSGGGTRCGMGSFAEGDVAGFSITVPNWEKAVGVRSSMGMRIDGAGIEVGMFARWNRQCVLHATVVGSSRMGKWSSSAKIDARLACEGTLR
jgi:hypothetical protein